MVSGVTVYLRDPRTTTLDHLNNAVIEECMKKHGIEINFMGIVLKSVVGSLNRKYREEMYVTIGWSKCLGADGVIISQKVLVIRQPI